MRFRDLFMITLIGMGTWQLAQLPFAGLGTLVPVAKEVNRTDADRSNVIGLDREQWVTFQIPDTSKAVRLLTNAAVENPETPVVTQVDPRSGWRYSVSYQLTDQKGNVIDQADYHFRSRVDSLIDVATGQPVYPMFFDDGSIATQTRVMQIGLSSFIDKKPSSIRVRFKTADANVSTVVARAMSQIERQDAHERTTWNRLSRQRRDAICKYCVYDSDLLGYDERANLLRWRWVNSPTLGEYEPKSIYKLSDLDDQAVAHQSLPSGKYTAANWISSVAVPGRGDVRLEFLSINDEMLQEISAEIQCIESQPGDRTLAIANSSNHVVHDVDGGLIQIKPDRECVIRAFWKPDVNSFSNSNDEVSESEFVANWMQETPPNANGEFEITPKAFKIRTYLVDESKVAYQISHFAQQSTPFRISARQICDNDFFVNSDDSPSATNNLYWEYLDAAGTIVDSGELEIDSTTTRFDHLRIRTDRILLSDANDFYFSVPCNVTKVCFRSESTPLLVSGAVRPADLVRHTRVPEDYSPFEQRKRLARSWYSLNPHNHNLLVQENRSFLANTQPMASEIDPLTLMGLYDWHRYVPDGNWIGREILVPMETLPERDELFQSVFYELPNGIDQTVELHDIQPALKKVQLFVASLAANDSPGKITVTVDDTIVYQRRHVSSRGTVELPMTAFQSDTTPMALRVSTENPCRLFCNGVCVRGATTFVKRTAQRLKSSALQFKFKRKTVEKELLTLTLYRTNESASRCQVKVNIEPENSIARSNVPVQGWSILNRVYDLKPTDDAQSLLLDTDRRVDAGYRCFITLDTDLPMGTYKINVQCTDKAEDAYALLHQTIPGKSPRKQIQSVPLLNRKLSNEFSEPVATHSHLKRINRNERSSKQPASRRIAPNFKRLNQTLKDLFKCVAHIDEVDRASDSELDKIQLLFQETAGSSPGDPELAAAWQKLGWDLVALNEFGIVVIKESEHQLKGRGAYAIRLDSQSNTILQSPHRFFDKQTGVIARKLFVENDVFAIAMNSSHRKHVDLAHQQQHYFNAFMQALTKRDTKVIQIHGFDAASKTSNTKTADVILSDTTRFPGRLAMQTAIRLKELLGKSSVRLYPLDVVKLGGTKNSQAKLLRNSGFHRFLHLELGGDLRKLLAGDASKRFDFAAALLGSAANPAKQPKP